MCKVRDLKESEVEFTLECEEEDIPVEGNCSAIDPEMNPLIRVVSYSRTTPESAEHGDFSETGWVNEEGGSCTPDDYDREDGLTCVDLAVKMLKDGAAYPSSTHFHTGIWYSADCGTLDYRTGEDEERSYHLKGFSPEEERAIFLHMTRKEK
jgi:hypothetical protein